MRPSVERAAPSSVGSTSGMAPITRVIAVSIACVAASKACSISAGICCLQQLVQRGLVLRLQAFEWQPEFRQKAIRGRVDERRRRAREYERHRDAEVLIHLAQLPEVGQLARPRDVADRGEECVLHDRAQQHVRAEGRGLLARCRQELRLGVALVAGDEVAVLLMDEMASVLADGTAPGHRPACGPVSGSRARRGRRRRGPPAARSGPASPVPA